MKTIKERPKKTKRMLLLEEKLGIPLEDALSQAYNETGSLRACTDKLNELYGDKLNGLKFKPGLVYYYMIRLGLSISKSLE